MFSFRHGILAAAVAAAFVSIGPAGHAATVTYVQTMQGCTGGCGIDINNKVVVSDAPGNGVFDILVSLDTSTATDWSFQKNSGDKTTGHSASFAFSSSINSLVVTVLTPATHFAPNSNNVMPAFAMAPLNFPANGYGLSTDQQQVYSTLDFHVTTGIITETLAQFVATLLVASDGTSVFAADVYSGNTGYTGVIGFQQCGVGISCPSTQIGDTPLPGAVWLFGTALAGAAGVGGWRRKKRNASLTAAA